jgi:hypothetical protein
MPLAALYAGMCHDVSVSHLKYMERDRQVSHSMKYKNGTLHFCDNYKSCDEKPKWNSSITFWYKLVFM